MRARQPPPDALTKLALHQAGVVSSVQVREAGMSRHALARLLREEHWQTLGYGVYSTSPGPPSWDAKAWAGCLLGGEGARLGVQASAHVHELQAEAPDPVDILVPGPGRVRAQGGWLFVAEAEGTRSPRTVGSPPRLTAEDTVLDLCAAGEESAAVGWVTSAVQRQLTSPEQLRAALGRRARLKHRALILGLVADAEEGAESALEVRYLRDVERAHGLPEGVRQQRRGGLPYRSDVGYDEYALLVELDGRQGHSGKNGFRDMWRDNQFVLTGRRTLRYGWFDVVDRACGVAWQVAGALVDGGWGGYPTRCPRCVSVPQIDLSQLP